MVIVAVVLAVAIAALLWYSYAGETSLFHFKDPIKMDVVEEAVGPGMGDAGAVGPGMGLTE